MNPLARIRAARCESRRIKSMLPMGHTPTASSVRPRPRQASGRPWSKLEDCRACSSSTKTGPTRSPRCTTDLARIATRVKVSRGVERTPRADDGTAPSPQHRRPWTRLLHSPRCTRTVRSGSSRAANTAPPHDQKKTKRRSKILDQHGMKSHTGQSRDLQVGVHIHSPTAQLVLRAATSDATSVTRSSVSLDDRCSIAMWRVTSRSGVTPAAVNSDRIRRRACRGTRQHLTP